MVVCHCKAVNDASINELLTGGQLTVDDIAERCGAGTDCGGCLETIEHLLGAAERALRSAA